MAVSAPVHSRLQRVAARRAGVDLVFASPVFTTRSHAGAAALGVKAYLRLTVGCGMAAVPLGGMTARRARGICRRRGGGPAGAPAFAAIDHWVDQARKRRG
jgi:thiamine-phosphate pyrophosphorylase